MANKKAIVETKNTVQFMYSDVAKAYMIAMLQDTRLQLVSEKIYANNRVVIKWQCGKWTISAVLINGCIVFEMSRKYYKKKELYQFFLS